ncbi:MAG: hypothetical protein OXC06_17710, partial [Acidimicrobiaceae bacterium]|nr:hypothetical protein [Acidimicrobiaceae bacterium]
MRGLDNLIEVVVACLSAACRDELSLLDRARIDSMITVVDAARLLEHFADELDVAELGIGADEDDER